MWQGWWGGWAVAGWQQCWFWSHTVCRSHPHHSGRVRYGTGASCHCMGFNSRAQPGSLIQQEERPCTDCRRPPEGAPRCSSDACPLRKLRGKSGARDGAPVAFRPGGPVPQGLVGIPADVPELVLRPGVHPRLWAVSRSSAQAGIPPGVPDPVLRAKPSS